MQKYTLHCTIDRESSATLLLPPQQHHISDVAIRRLGKGDREPTKFAYNVSELYTYICKIM